MREEPGYAEVKLIIAKADKLGWVQKNPKGGYPLMNLADVEKCIIALFDPVYMKLMDGWIEDIEKEKKGGGMEGKTIFRWDQIEEKKKRRRLQKQKSKKRRAPVKKYVRYLEKIAAIIPTLPPKTLQNFSPKALAQRNACFNSITEIITSNTFSKWFGELPSKKKLQSIPLLLSYFSDTELNELETFIRNSLAERKWLPRHATKYNKLLDSKLLKLDPHLSNWAEYALARAALSVGSIDKLKKVSLNEVKRKVLNFRKKKQKENQLIASCRRGNTRRYLLK